MGEPSVSTASFDRLPLPTVIIRDARFIYANDAFLTLLAATREQVIGMRFDQQLAPEDRPRVVERHARRLRGEVVPDSYEFDLLRLDGGRRTVEIFISRAGDDTLFQLLDVTPRVARQENLRALARLGAAVQSELSAEAIFDTLARGIGELGGAMVRLRPVGDRVQLVVARGSDLEPLAGTPGLFGPFTKEVADAWASGFLFVDDVSLALQRFFGDELSGPVREVVQRRSLTRGAVVRLDVQGGAKELLVVVASWLQPEDQPTLALFGAQVRAALEAARIIHHLFERNAALTALNHVATAAGESRDLADLFRTACAEIVSFTHCSAVAMFALEETGEYLELVHSAGTGEVSRASEDASRAYARVKVAGSRPEQVLASRTAGVFRLADLDEQGRETLARMGQEMLVMVPMLVRSRAIGVINLAHPVVREVPQEELDLLGAMAVHLGAAIETSRLVHDLRRSYDELFDAQAQLVQRERLAALGEMAAAVAHEVRNPLAVIFNSLATLRRAGKLDAANAQLVEMASEESERIDHLISDLLELARPTLPALTNDVALGPLIQECVTPVVRNAKGRVKLNLDVDAELGQPMMDPRMMRQVLLNLAANAVQAMPDGGTLTVRARRVPGPSAPLVQVTFTDTGHGIPKDVLPRIFEPFFTTRARGTGLGLTLVKRIIEGHQGEVFVQSTRGEGTSITIQFPSG